MPKNTDIAIRFLETQWSGINDNKVKGIIAETEFRNYLIKNQIHHIPGGWILTPGKNTNAVIPSLHKICLIPIEASFSWNNCKDSNTLTPAQMSAYNFFRQVGVTTYFVYANKIDESQFQLPTKSNGKLKATYPRPYKLLFKSMDHNGQFVDTNFETMMQKFPIRNGNMGMRSYEQGRINRSTPPWSNPSIISELFWFEYTRYYCQVDYLVSNNDLDLFIVGQSGSAYPVELKSKSPVVDSSLGDWFGLDVGPFAKMTFFTANSMNTDALYVVQEVDEFRNHIEWLALKFTDLVKNCSWVIQSGGKGMMGGASSTIKIPKAAFTPLDKLLPRL